MSSSEKSTGTPREFPKPSSKTPLLHRFLLVGVVLINLLIAFLCDFLPWPLSNLKVSGSILLLLLVSSNWLISQSSLSIFDPIIIGISSWALILGFLIGNSASPVVGSAFPALLAFAGGSLLTIVTQPNAEQLQRIGASLVCFSLALFWGLTWGISERVSANNSSTLMLNDLRQLAETTTSAENQARLQRLFSSGALKVENFNQDIVNLLVDTKAISEPLFESIISTTSTSKGGEHTSPNLADRQRSKDTSKESGGVVLVLNSSETCENLKREWEDFSTSKKFREHLKGTDLSYKIDKFLHICSEVKNCQLELKRCKYPTGNSDVSRPGEK